MGQRGGYWNGLRRREQAADAWSRGGRTDIALPDLAARRLQMFTHFAGLLGEHATPQLSPSSSLQPAASPYPVLVYSRPEAGPGGGTQAGS